MPINPNEVIGYVSVFFVLACSIGTLAEMLSQTRDID
jgi:hypothetical protein